MIQRWSTSLLVVIVAAFALSTANPAGAWIQTWTHTGTWGIGTLQWTHGWDWYSTCCTKGGGRSHGTPSGSATFDQISVTSIQSWTSTNGGASWTLRASHGGATWFNSNDTGLYWTGGHGLPPMAPSPKYRVNATHTWKDPSTVSFTSYHYEGEVPP